MRLALHPDARYLKLAIGKEKAPLLVIDNFVAAPEQLVKMASLMDFAPAGRYFPGIRAQAPREYTQFIMASLGGLLTDCFGLEGKRPTAAVSQFSLITTPAENLALMQRMPHIDSNAGNNIALIHYLFHKNLGGTSFYRHRSTGFEYIDETRKEEYFRVLEQESKNRDFPGCDYINGDTPFFERIDEKDGVFNRMLVYRQNSLHSGSIGESFVPDANPLTGRLSINSFIDLA